MALPSIMLQMTAATSTPAQYLTAKKPTRDQEPNETVGDTTALNYYLIMSVTFSML